MNFDIAFSIILGFIFGYFINNILFKNEYHGPNSKDMLNKIHKNGNDCYIFEPIITICPSNISMK